MVDETPEGEEYDGEEQAAAEFLAQVEAEAEKHTEEGEIEHTGHFPVELLGDTLFLMWQDAFMTYSVRNEYYSSGCFHLVFGQMPNIRNIKIMRSNGSHIDSRVHVAFLAPSASGKGEGLTFVQKMCDKLQLKLQTVDRVTDAGLVGTYKRDEEGELRYTPGWLHPDNGINILAAKEATNVLRDVSRDPTAQEILNTFQNLMNTMNTSDGVISKKLAEGEVIEFHPNCSLLFTSFLLPYMDEIILDRGLFQRMYFTIKETSLRDRKKEQAILRSKKVNKESQETLESDIAERIKYVDNLYAGIQEMHISPGALEVFETEFDHLLEMLETLDPTTQDQLSPFLGRFENLQTKVAMHFACLNLHKRIERKDAELAAHYSRKLFESIIVFLSLRAEPSKKALSLVKKIMGQTQECLEALTGTVRYADTKGFVDVPTLTMALVIKHELTDHIAQEYLIKLEAWNRGQFTDKEGVRWFRLKRKGTKKKES